MLRMPPRRILETTRLTLHATSPEHVDGLWRAVEPSLPELRVWLAWAVDPTINETRVFAEDAAHNWERESGFSFTILFGGEPAGGIALNGYVPLIRRAEMGYWLRSDLARRGLMTEAASAVVEFGFEDVGLHRIELRAAPGNAASIRIAEKLGFRREGRVRDGSRGADGFYDCEVFGLLEGDPRRVFHK